MPDTIQTAPPTMLVHHLTYGCGCSIARDMTGWKPEHIALAVEEASRLRCVGCRTRDFTAHGVMESDEHALSVTRCYPLHDDVTALATAQPDALPSAGQSWQNIRSVARLGPRERVLRVYPDQSIVRLSRDAWEALGRPESVEVLWDALARRIGFRASDAAQEGLSYRVLTRTERESACLCCAYKLRGILRASGIAWTSTALALPLSMVDGVLCAEWPEHAAGDR